MSEQVRRPTTPSPEKTDSSNMRRQATAWALASNFGFGVMGMGFLGWAIQRWMWPSSAPWLLLGGLGLGLFGGGYVFVRDALRMNRDA